MQTNQSSDLLQLLLSASVPGEATPCVLVDAVEVKGEGQQAVGGGGHRIECLVAHVQEATPEQRDKHDTHYLTMFHWVTFTSG